MCMLKNVDVMTNLMLYFFQLSKKFSTSQQRYKAKFYSDASEAVKDIPDNAKLLVGGNTIIIFLAIKVPYIF